jgi:membrane associated rhomboid family serine protease
MAQQRNFASRFGRFHPTPVVVVTLGLLLVMFLFTGFAANFVPGGARAYELMIFDAREVMQGEVWRLVSYGVIHDLRAPFHLLMNGLMLWFFARDIEQRFGSLKFLGFLVIALVVGGLFVMGGFMLGIGSPLVLGFSAATEACIVAWALFNRDAPVSFFMVLPMRGIHMLLLAVLMWMLDAVSASQVSASAHLGGIITGLVTWFLVARRNRIRLFFMELGKGKKAKLTVVPKNNDRWVN